MKGDRDGVYNTAAQGMMLRPTIVDVLVDPCSSVAVRGVTSSRRFPACGLQDKAKLDLGLVKICRPRG